MFQSFLNLKTRIRNRCRWEASHLLGRRMGRVQLDVPIISFTFDDFPSSALNVGGEILRQHGVRGTYYVSLGLMDQEIPAGRAFSAEDLMRLVADGHELGCHTFAHCHAWETEPRAFEESILQNRRALKQLMPKVVMQTLSYPISCPRPQTKRVAAKYFSCARGGGQTFNAGTADLDCLNAFFLEKCKGDVGQIKRIVDANASASGWLVFATHDVCSSPTRFGCTPDVFGRVVDCAVESGAAILPVWEALQRAFTLPTRDIKGRQLCHQP